MLVKSIKSNYCIDTIKSRKEIGFPKKSEWYKTRAKFTKNSLIIANHSIMEKWERNYMKMLSDIVTQNGGDILEVGFGMGISCHYIQNQKSIKTHTIIEFHPDVIKRCKHIYHREIKINKIILIEGFWEDTVMFLKNNSFDGILFDTYPLTEEQLHKNHFWFFNEAYRLLRNNGIFTYYSDEWEKLSRVHLHKLKEAGFKKIYYKTCRVSPPQNCIYWKKNTIIAPIISK